MAILAKSNPIAPSQSEGPTPVPSRRLWIPFLVLIAAIAPYLPSLRFNFVYDDNVQVLAIPAIRSWSAVPSYFFSPIPEVVVRYYRPIFFLWFRLNYWLWNTHAWGWHMTNLALHGVACILAFFVLSRYFKEAKYAAGGALMFAVHPAHVETVAWVSGCTDSLMAIGLLGSLLLWMKSRDAPTFARQTGSLLCFAVALLTKETAVILPAVIWFHALIGIPKANQEDESIGKRVGRALWNAAPYAVLTAVYLAIRSSVLTGIRGTPNWLSHAQSFMTAPSLLLFYVKHVFFPLRLSIFYDFPVVTRVGSYLFWSPLLTMAAITFGAWLLFRRRRDGRILISAFWIVVPVAPVLYIRMFQPDEFIHDRYLYLPVLGLSVLIGILFEFLGKQRSVEKTPPILALVAGVVVLLLAVATAVQAEPWKSDLSLYSHAVQVAPKNTMARNNLASEYATEGRYQEASAVLRTVLEDRPRMWLANYNYGYVNYRMGNFAIAEDYLRRAMAIDATDSDQYLYLGTTYFKEGRLAEAAEQLRHGIALRPNGNGYHFTLGIVELQQGNVAGAREELQMELKYHPENAGQVSRALAMLQQ